MYDLFVSLGGNCGAASQLKMRGLRACALPFDWLAMATPGVVDYLAEGFSDGFKNFCRKDNLRPFAGAAVEVGCTKFCYEDTYTGYRFIHHFRRPITEAGVYEDVRGMFERRICRLLKRLHAGERVLFVLATPFAFDPARAVSLLAHLRSLFPKSTIDMACLQFGVTFDNPLTTSERWPADLPFVAGGRYAHALDEYAFERTGKEWTFLDEAEPSVPVRRPRGWDKQLYKLWKKLSKRLLERGYACKGMTFFRR